MSRNTRKSGTPNDSELPTDDVVAPDDASDPSAETAAAADDGDAIDEAEHEASDSDRDADDGTDDAEDEAHGTDGDADDHAIAAQAHDDGDDSDANETATTAADDAPNLGGDAAEHNVTAEGVRAAGEGDDAAASTDDEDGPHLRPLDVEPHQPELPNIDDIHIDIDTLVDPVEAIIFAAGDPVSVADIKRVLERSWGDDHQALREKKLGMMRDIIKLLKRRWAAHGDSRGFGLIEVAEGFTFRSNPRYAGYLRATREERPVRLSRPALETLAIIAYRQPATKPEIDHIRGVDCGGTIRVLLDRNLVRIVGKRDEPGRPMLYGTTREFLSFFNLPSLAQLPSLREFSELTEESQEEVNALGGAPSLDELSRNAKKLRLDEEPAVQALDEAVVDLDSTESKTRDAFASQGITIDPAAENPPAEQTPNERETGS